MDVGTIEDPGAVGFGPEDIAGCFNAFQDFAVGAAAYALGGEQAGALALAFFDVGAGFFEPVAAKIGLAGDAAG